MPAERHRVERDPDSDEHGLADDELGGTEEPRETFRTPAETVGAERAVQVAASGTCIADAAEPASSRPIAAGVRRDHLRSF
jgi:hypothetical protein